MLKNCVRGFLYLICSSALFAQAVFEDADLATLEFSTDEVTWLSVDIAPDGKTFVVDVLGDLYTLPRAGGIAAQLTEGVAFDSQPVFSPDGKTIAFVSDRSGSENLWIMAADGTEPRKITSLGSRFELASPAWSPDGSHVIVAKRSWGQRTNEIWAYSLDGGKGVRLTRTGDTADHTERHNALGAVYSPDSKYLYYATKRGGFGYNLTFPQWQIARKDLQSGREDTITNAPGSAFRPQLSPSASAMVYGTRFSAQTGLRIRHFEDGRDEWLVYPIQRDEQESTFTRDLLPKFTFSPDGYKVFYTADGKLFSIDIRTRRISEINFEIPVKLKHYPRKEFKYRLGIGPVRATVIRSPELSNDQSKLTFTAFGQVHVYDLEGHQIKALTTTSDIAANPTWSPKDNRIAYVTWGQDGGHLWTVAANGRGKPQQISKTPAFYSDPLWLPDGRAIVLFRSAAYNRQVAGWDQGYGTGADLIKIDIRSGETTFVRHAGMLTGPHLGPVEDRIYLYETPGLFSSGNGYLVSIRMDGTDWRRHLSLKGPGIYYEDESVPAFSIFMSPDGTYAIAQHTNQLYVVRLLGKNPAFVRTNIENGSVPIAKLTDVGVDEIGWSRDGKTIYWTVGNEFFLRRLASIEFDKPDTDEEENTEQSKSEDKNGINSEDSDGDKTELTEDAVLENHESVEHSSIIVYQPRDVPRGKVLLLNGNLITMQAGQEPVLLKTDLLIENDRITEIGPDLEVSNPDFTLDISGKFVLPGFVDTHAHLPLLRRVIGSEAWSLAASLAYGVTTAIDVQPSTIDILDYANLVESGKLIGPRVLTTGPGVFMDNEFKSQAHAKNVLSRYKNHYGVNNIKSYISGSREQRQWLAIASQQLQLMTTTEGALDLKRNITHAIDGFAGNEHNLPVIGIYTDVTKLYGHTQIAYTPTLLVAYGGPFALNYFVSQESPWLNEKLRTFTPPHVLEQTLLRSNWVHPIEHVFTKHAQQARKILKDGGRVGIGSHGELQGLGYHWELWAVASGGFTPLEALNAATLHGAEMIGVATDVGSITEGKLADLVVLQENPLDDIRATTTSSFVIKNGVVYEAETLSEIWPNKRELNQPFWSDHIPEQNQPAVQN